MTELTNAVETETMAAAGGEPAAATLPRVQAEPRQPLELGALMVALTADEIERSLRFYVDGLGFAVEERMEEDGKLLGVMLVAGACHLGLSQDDWGKGRDRKKGIGFRMFVDSLDLDLEAVAKRFRDHGVEVDGPTTEPWGERSLTVVDPDGFKLTLHRKVP
jgi:catechol 2,3-dioxygenase-like lactoylglutathione lyase family enzyme